MAFPGSFLRRPLAHRGLHGEDRPENSRAAVEAAIEAGYGSEIDVQLSNDGEAMVFHDYYLGRLTDRSGAVSTHRSTDLARIPLRGCDEGIPLLSDILRLVAGRAPLLIEIKDQDGAMGQRVGPLESAVAEALMEYDGDAAVMSFNPHAIERIGRIAPHVPHGLTTSSFRAEDWPTIPHPVRERLRAIPDYHRVGASFISHEAGDLDRDRVAELKRQGASVLCWTIRSPEEEARARSVADNVTFEGYLPG